MKIIIRNTPKNLVNFCLRDPRRPVYEIFTHTCGHVCRCVDQKGLAAMLTSIQSAGVTPEVNLRNSTQTRKCASKKSTLALKPTADVTTSPKQGYQWPHEKDMCSPKIKKRKRSKWPKFILIPVFVATEKAEILQLLIIEFHAQIK